MKENISIVLLGIWCTFSGAMLGIGVDIENNEVFILDGFGYFRVAFKPTN